jgi:hypothetical protein
MKWAYSHISESREPLIHGRPAFGGVSIAAKD